MKEIDQPTTIPLLESAPVYYKVLDNEVLVYSEAGFEKTISRHEYEWMVMKQREKARGFEERINEFFKKAKL